MKRLSTKKQLNSKIQNEEIVKTPTFRSYSEVVAFGNNDHCPKNSKVFSMPIRQMSAGNYSTEAFPPLTDIGSSFPSNENDVVILSEHIDTEKSEIGLTSYGNYLEKRFKVDESENIEVEVNLRSILAIEIDDFNFTEVDEDPESSSFPRFIGVFEDKNYLKLEKEVLKSFENFVI